MDTRHMESTGLYGAGKKASPETLGLARCTHPTREPGIAMGQTTNSGPSLSRYPCGPGYVMPCLKCPQCGHSVTAGEGA